MTDDDRQQTDRQTDHATEKCVGIGKIALAASLALQGRFRAKNKTTA